MDTMIAIYRRESGYPFTGVIAKSVEEAKAYVKAEYHKKNPKAYIDNLNWDDYYRFEPVHVIQADELEI